MESTLQIRKAERKKAKLRLGIAGPSGSGKTMGALKLANGIGKKICIIDTERGSGDLYADMFDYDIISLRPPYKPAVYAEAIKMAEDAGYDVIIVDSLSHAWSDEGGILDQADKKSAAGNRFTVWAELTPQHRLLVNSMLNSTAHIIATVRSKQEYAMDRDEKTGKSTVKKLGMAPVQRDGMEYEFTVFIDVDQNHYSHVSKDRTNMFKDEIFLLDETIGGRLLEWLNTGREQSEIDKEEAKKEGVEKNKKIKIVKELMEKLGKKPTAETEKFLSEKRLKEINNIVKKLTDDFSNQILTEDNND